MDCRKNDKAVEWTETEKLHFEAMLFRAQCRWRDYEEMMARPHSRKAELRLLDELDMLDSNLRDMGLFSDG